MRDVASHLNAALDGRYRIERELGRGGMATVYLAQDVKHHRPVALKILHRSLAQAIGVQRFLQEVDVVARLEHPHLLTLIDSGEVDGMPFYVMPYVEGKSLADLLAREGRLTPERAVSIAGEVADAMAYAHAQHVIHRDLKPSNILMSGDHAVVADFGIAAALDRSHEERLTETGISLGSPVYMSPEQAAGERQLDARTDIYALGCIVFELLAGQPPVDAPSLRDVVTQKLTGRFTPLRERNSAVTRLLSAAVHRALATAPEERFRSMEEFAEALRGAVRPRVPVRRGTAAWVAAGLGAALLLGGTALVRGKRTLDATRQMAEIAQRVGTAEYTHAFELAEQARRGLPGDTMLARLTPAFTDYLSLVSDPAGAVVSRRRLEGDSGRWERVGSTPLDRLAIPKYGGNVPYVLRLEAPGHEPTVLLPHVIAPWGMWRNVAPVDTVRLTRRDPTYAGLVWAPGWTARDTLHPVAGSIRVGDYWIGRTEVTNQEFQRFVAAGGYDRREYWLDPFVEDGRTLSWEESINRFRDRTGLPGPATWSNGTYPTGEADFPVGGVSYYEAAAYARFLGARLPTAAHWIRATLRWANEAAWIYMPSSNMGGSGPRRVGDGSMNPLGLFDVAGNVREWCVNPIEGGRLTRGGGWEDPEFIAGHLVPKPPFDRAPSNGFRIMRTQDPDSTIAHLAGEVRRVSFRDYSTAKPVGDSEFEHLRRLYDYDAAPLDAKVEARGIGEQYRWEKVSFAAAQGGERMAAYLFLPRTAQPPYQAVVYWPGTSALAFRSVMDDPRTEQWFGFLPRGGRALVLPLLKGTYERDDSLFSITGAPQGARAARDLAIEWVKDFRRAIDYVQSRDDIASDRLAYYGYSWGGYWASVALAVEPRLRVAILNTAGLGTGPGQPLPEVDPVNFLPRVKTPVLMLNGQHDVVYPYASAQVPFFRLLGSARTDKEHRTYRATHVVPLADNVRETLRWLDRYLAPAAVR